MVCPNRLNLSDKTHMGESANLTFGNILPQLDKMSTK